MNFEDILNMAPYSLGREEKRSMLTERLTELTDFHEKNCPAYSEMLHCVSYGKENASSYEDLPYLPVRLFKEMTLRSVGEEEIVKTMTSSGTTGQQVSKIYLDRATSSNQQKAMVKIVSDFTGSGRMPMIIIDCPSVIRDRAKFSARGAGILGFSVFGTKKFYALDDDMKLNVEGLREFLEDCQGQRILLFGFTFMIWQHFYKELLRLEKMGIVFDLSNGILIHGGGWKKLQSEAVSREAFHDSLKAVCGLARIHDYYGMVEQTGCISMECECGHLHASIFSDVIARRPKDFSVCEHGEPGILQTVSVIPESYPGHILLTEDEGVVLGEDDCPCGRKGKYFQVLGRIAKAEIRGCSDTYAADSAAGHPSGEMAADVLSRVSFLVGSAQNMKKIVETPPREPFDDEVVDFLSALSKALMDGKDSRQYPDVVTLGFWLRRSSLMALKKRFSGGEGWKVGRGVAFHVAPSNVPVNYAYSLFAGLICGNANIVRIPSKDFPQVEIINAAIQHLLEDERFVSLKPYIFLIRYSRDREVNDYFSSICDVRVIWGGDGAIGELRKSPLMPRAIELVFADRYSLSVIDSEAYLSSDRLRVASDFYNDTYLSDQNACTSPRAVVWTGGRIPEAKGAFWEELNRFAEGRYPFQAIQGVDKLALLYLAAANCGDLRAVQGDGNLLRRVQASRLSPRLMDYRGSGGFFYEYDCGDILEIRDFCNDTRCQTVSYLGEKEMLCPLLSSGVKGIDRVVPLGHAMDFDLIWDGYQLVERLTRTVRF